MRIIKILFVFIFSGLLWNPALAAGMEVTLYPASADVREELSVQPENGKFSILLPRDVQRGTVRVSVEGAVVQSLGFSEVPLVDSPRVAGAREAVTAARRVLGELDDQLSTLGARTGLWLSPPVQLSDPDALAKADAAVAASLPPLLAEKAKLETLRAEAERELLRREAELRRISGLNEAEPAEGKAALTTPELTVLVAAQSQKPLTGEMRVVLDYTLDNCGWEPEYRLEAFTGKNMVRVSRLAALRQNSGRDWANATLRLATSRPSAHVVPVPVREWRLQPAGLQQRAFKTAAPMAMSAASSAANESFDSAAPTYEEGAAFMTWDLGQRTINSGDSSLLLLDAQDWKADFYRLLRPSQQRESWLMATVTPATPQILPKATARLVVDGVSMGETSFAFSGDKGDVALGTDSAVTADMVLDSNQSGDRGIIAKSQTRVWSWRLTARNAHAVPVTVRMEDAEPQSGDERIAVRVESTPKPATEDHVLRWALTIPGNGKSEITHKVSMSAPADMQVWMGR